MSKYISFFVAPTLVIYETNITFSTECPGTNPNPDEICQPGFELGTRGSPSYVFSALSVTMEIGRATTVIFPVTTVTS